MKKRIFSLLLALCLVAGMLPTVAYAYDNTGTIDSGEYWEEVTNNGTINGGTFYYTVNNSHVGYIGGGTFYGTVNNVEGGLIQNGTFNGVVNNGGDSYIYNGTFYDSVNNDDGTITGGTFYGTVSGSGTIEDSAKVTITFNSDNGNAVQEEKVLRGQKVSVPTEPTKEDCTFIGWYNGDTEFNFANTPVTENITLTAKWTVDRIKLDQETLEGLTASESDYYHLQRDNSSYLCSNVSASKTILIQSISNDTTITLDLNGFTLTGHAPTPQGNSAIIIGKGPTMTLTLIDSSSNKTGKIVGILDSSSDYTVWLFARRTLNANGGTIEGPVFLEPFSTVNANSNSSNVTLFTGDVKNNGGSINGGIFNGTVTNGILASYRGTINGGIFNGNVDNKNGIINGGIFYGTVSDDGTINDSAKVSVTFDSDGGNTVTEQKVLRGQKATEPTVPTKTGYSFEGWYNGDTEFNFANTPVIEKIGLTAKWVEKSNISFNTAPQSYTYNGATQIFSITGTSVTGFDISYKQNGQTVATPTDAGSYDVIITRAEDNTYNAVDVTISNGLVINPKSIEDAVITTSNTLTYNGTEQTQNVTVTLAGFDTVTFDVSGNKQTDVNASGDYTLTVTGNGNFTGSKNLDWNIAPATPTENPAKKTTARVVRGRTLADATVTNGEILGVDGATVLTGTFAWVDSTKVMSADGTEQMVFTPDNTNYAPITIDVAVSTYTTGGGSTYAITVESAKNGTVTAAPRSAARGTTVTLTVEPDKGYTLETLTVTDKNGNEIELTNKGDGKYTFKMPGSKVNVKATFMEDNSMLNFFVDVFPGDYYYDAVLWAAENDITGGVDDTHFAPNAPCTRAQIVTFLWRAADSPVVNDPMNFSDVPADAYYAEAVRWAVSQGITKGTGDTTFGPDATCTRAQAMTFIYRSEQAQGGGMQGAWMFLNPFDDVNLESYYGEAVMWAVANGVTDGTTATTFSPNANCTRAQIVTFLYRCLGE